MKSREEILKIARECQSDERVKHTKLAATQSAFGWGIFWAAVIMLIKLSHDQPWQDSFALIGLMAACFDFSQYAHLRQRWQLLYGLIWLLVGAACLWFYIGEI